MYYGIAILAGLLIIAGSFFAFRTFSTPTLTYSNAEQGIAFEYPATYAVEEHAFADRHTIVLADKEAVLAAPQNGEGPTTITFDVFDNPTNLSPTEWVRTNSASNFQLSTGALASTTQAGTEAVAYMWDGLYRGESYVFQSGDRIVMASVTMLELTDSIRADFERVLRTLALQ